MFSSPTAAQNQPAEFIQVVSAPVQDLSKLLGIIDMHVHALSANHFGGVGLKVCPGNVQKTFPAADPRAKITTDDLEDCPNPLYSAKTDEEVLRLTKLYGDRYNIKGVASGISSGWWKQGSATVSCLDPTR